MAYASGSATGVVDLLTKLEAFAAAHGWTTDSFATDGSGKRYHAHKGSVYINARAYVAETPDSDLAAVSGSATCLAFNLGSGYSGANRWFDQAGVAVGTSSKTMSAGMNAVTGSIPTYHFFANASGAGITVVLEYAAGFYQFLAYGTLTKYGTYTGGLYLTGSCSGVSNSLQASGVAAPGVGFFTKENMGGKSPAFVTASVDSESGWHWTGDYNVNQDLTRRYIRDNELRYAHSLAIQPNSLNGLAILMPVVVSIERDANHNGSTRFSPLGEVPNTYLLKISQLTPGQPITLGSDDYRVFPFYHKDASVDTPTTIGTGNSSYFGFAVKE